jgi:hypothetical protein
MARRARRRKVLVIVLVVLVALIAVGGVSAYTFLTRDDPVVYGDIVEQYKYGSIGTEELQGIPYELWVVLPDVFADLLPPGPGQGYERFGFLYEPGHDRPIGTTYREKPIGLLGLNCALCHVGTYRASPTSPRQKVLGMPSNNMRLWDYIQFLRKVRRDERFNADTLLAAIDRRFPGRLSFLERRFWRYAVIPQTKDGLREADQDFTWLDSRPPYGPGRVDTFNPLKQRADFDMEADHTVGTVDFPSIWKQRTRVGMYLHWDGNNNSLRERNLSAARAVGGTDDSMDIHQLNRIANWLLDLSPRPFPRDRIDRQLARRGQPLYGQQCASCHDLGGARIGQVTPIGEIGTDRERLDSFTPALVTELNTNVGKGKPWRFRHFRKTNGYANLLLEGIWLRAPYLHNGSVPTLRALLFPVERPKVFYIGYDVYDWKDVGFVSSGSAARREGWRYDTSVRGNGNEGHLYGTDLPPAQRLAIIEYLKTR